MNIVQLFVMASNSDLPEGSIISFDAQLLKSILPQIVNVILLTVILGAILYKPVRNFLDQRTENIQNRLDNARDTQNEAEELKEKYEGLIAEIEVEREAVLSSAYKKAMERSDHILQQAKEEADSIYHHAMEELEEERQSVNDEMKRQLIELSTLLAEQFVAVSIDSETQDRLVDEALGDWEESLWLD